MRIRRASSCGVNRLDDLFGRLRVGNVVDHDIGPRLGQSDGDGLANPRVRAGVERLLPEQYLGNLAGGGGGVFNMCRG